MILFCIREQRLLPCQGDPSAIAIHKDVGETNSGQNFATRIDDRIQPANVAEVAIHMRMQVAELVAALSPMGDFASASARLCRAPFGSASSNSAARMQPTAAPSRCSSAFAQVCSSCTRAASSFAWSLGHNAQQASGNTTNPNKNTCFTSDSWNRADVTS